MRERSSLGSRSVLRILLSKFDFRSPCFPWIQKQFQARFLPLFQDIFNTQSFSLGYQISLYIQLLFIDLSTTFFYVMECLNTSTSKVQFGFLKRVFNRISQLHDFARFVCFQVQLNGFQVHNNDILRYSNQKFLWYTFAEAFLSIEETLSVSLTTFHVFHKRYHRMIQLWLIFTSFNFLFFVGIQMNCRRMSTYLLNQRLRNSQILFMFDEKYCVWKECFFFLSSFYVRLHFDFILCWW